MELLNEICLFGEGHCFNTRSPAASSVYCYALALAYTVSVSIQRSRLGEHGHATHLLPVKRMRWLPTFLILSYLTRITWLLLSEMHAFEWVNDQTYTHMILPVPFLPTSMDIYVLGVSSFNKLATLFYFSAFTLLLRFWDDVLYLAKRSDKPLARMAANQSVLAEYTRPHAHPRSRTLFVVANVWIYLVEGVLLVLKTLFPHQELFLFQADYSFVALFFFALSLMLARSAYKLRQVLLRIEFSSLAASIAWRVTWLGTILSIVFLGRSVLLLIATPAIEVFDPHRSNPWLFYTIPEIVPGWVVIYMMTVKKPSKQPTHRRNRMDETTPLLPISPLERHASDETISPFEGLELRI